jgi:hypothetical protein
MHNSKKSTFMFVSSLFILASIYSFFFFLQCLLASHLTLFPLPTLLLLGPCNHCILACFIWSRNCEHSLSNYSLCCFCWYRPNSNIDKYLPYIGSNMHTVVYYLCSLPELWHGLLLHKTKVFPQPTPLLNVLCVSTTFRKTMGKKVNVECGH